MCRSEAHDDLFRSVRELCFAGYGAAGAALGIDMAGAWWVGKALTAAGLAAAWVVVTALSIRRRDAAPILLASIGVGFVAGARLTDAGRAIELIGFIAVAAAGWLNAFRCRSHSRRRLAPPVGS